MTVDQLQKLLSNYAGDLIAVVFDGRYGANELHAVQPAVFAPKDGRVIPLEPGDYWLDVKEEHFPDVEGVPALLIWLERRGNAS